MATVTFSALLKHAPVRGKAFLQGPRSFWRLASQWVWAPPRGGGAVGHFAFDFRLPLTKRPPFAPPATSLSTLPPFYKLWGNLVPPAEYPPVASMGLCCVLFLLTPLQPSSERESVNTFHRCC